MDSTRHEKAALISVAYFIGALTAFIWYGASQSIDLTVTENGQGQSASVISAVKQPKAAEKPSERTSVALYHDGVLDVKTIDGTKILSFNPEKSGFANSPEFAIQGTHFGKLVYTVSPTEEYIFFCEQKSVDASTCSPFIYDVLQDKIYALSASTGAFDITLAGAKTAVFDSRGLSLDGAVSVSLNTPWLMTSN